MPRDTADRQTVFELVPFDLPGLIRDVARTHGATVDGPHTLLVIADVLMIRRALQELAAGAARLRLGLTGAGHARVEVGGGAPPSAFVSDIARGHGGAAGCDGAVAWLEVPVLPAS